ncbi:S-adenosyl-L-methionine-dependent methyltransferase [Mariannaea sp. PMI_226]|nr:S-adenosyl-L-methionine-dependent methyltransferase [Mariannaea sp. PMI_226]
MSSEDSGAPWSGRQSSEGDLSEHAQSDGAHTAMTSIMDLDEDHHAEVDFEDEEDVDIISIYPPMHYQTGSHELHFSQEHPHANSSDVAASTRSLWVQELDYRDLYGRRYCREYYMPNDEIEQLRLSLQHQVFAHVLEGNYTLAPIQNPSHILDIGTGTGEWAIKMAELYPRCEVVGTDISAIAETRGVPQNVFFEIEDAEDWDRLPDMYDLIHFRSMEGSFRNWKFMYQSALYSLKPGSWIEVQDFDSVEGVSKFLDQFPPDSPMRALNTELIEAAAKSGRPRGTAHLDPRLFIEAGFVDVRVTEYTIPITIAEKSAGKIWLISCLDAVEASCLRLLIEQKGWDVEKCKAACEQAARELANLAKDPEKSKGLQLKMRVVVARKPMDIPSPDIASTVARSSSPATALADEGSPNPTLHPGDEDNAEPEMDVLLREPDNAETA